MSIVYHAGGVRDAPNGLPSLLDSGREAGYNKDAMALLADQFEKYSGKLLRDRIALANSIRFYRLDDVVISGRDDEWLPVFTKVFAGLNATALLLARPPLPFGDLLVAAAGPAEDRIVPKDSETKTFHHDFPFLRKSDWQGQSAEETARRIVRCLKERKAVIVEGLGFIGMGSVTVEQAYIVYSTVFHATFLKFCLDVLEQGFRNNDEAAAFNEMRLAWALPVEASDVPLRESLRAPSAECGVRSAGCDQKNLIYDEIVKVGRATVEKGLVDSFFGNISFFDGKTIYISQTASSLDELEGHIDPVPLDGSSTAGLSASSELPAHRAIYQSTGFNAILHGHPKFSVILSMFCEEQNCAVKDCGRDCKRTRSICGIPIVSGELGAGGLARTVPAAIKETGVCIVYGHGVFAGSENDFRGAFRKLVEAENKCREEYFRMVNERNK
ncbi:MAG: class II aldolase/adducin family protein [Nitrospirota bacterium]|nr:class II aldolase/adducin family protein [Nitrospirota bacterium]